MRILFLEYDARDRHSLENALINEGLGSQIICAKSKEEFHAALKQGRYDLIVSNLALPDADRNALLAASHELQSDAPVLFVAGAIGEAPAKTANSILKNHQNGLEHVIRLALGKSSERKERQPVEGPLRFQSSALEAVANGILLTDATGKILFANRAFCVMTGYAPEEILGKTPAFLNSGKQDAGFFRDLWNTILNGQVWQGELINRRKDGTLYHEEMTITPIRAENGNISQFISVKQDITQRKQFKEQLHQARKMEAIGQLAGGIAHDFNNLLTVIHGNVQLVMMANRHLDEENSQWLKQAIDATERAGNLIRHLLAFGRKQDIQFQPLNLNHVISNFTKMLHRVIGENITLRCSYAKDLPPVDADIGMMEQVLINLIVNARDAMPEGGSITIATEAIQVNAVRLQTHPEAQLGQFVRITVSDTGSGIYPEYLPRIFEPFFTTKEAGKGTGLGLATVYGIVKQHQGWIEVSSRLGSGTTFEIFLPAGIYGGPKASLQLKKTVPADGHEKILLVEDDADVRMVARDVLEESGYQILEASDGSEALNVWKSSSSQVDLLLTDIIMPGGLNGWELADRLRGEQPGLKVILMSGYSHERFGKIQLNSHILPKPFSSESLTETVRSCLDSARVTS